MKKLSSPVPLRQLRLTMLTPWTTTLSSSSHHILHPVTVPAAAVEATGAAEVAAAAASSSLAEVMTQYPTDMDVDADDSLALLDAHDTPAEKVDADFFNGARAARGGTLSRVPRSSRARSRTRH